MGNPVCEHAEATANYCTLELGHQITSSQFRTRSVIGAVAGGATFLVLLLLAGVYAYRQKKRRERASEQENHFGTFKFLVCRPDILPFIIENCRIISFALCFPNCSILGFKEQ